MIKWCSFSGYNDNGARSMAREQSDECGKTRLLSLDLLYNGGVGWSWYVLCWKTTVLFVVVFSIHIPPTEAFLGLYNQSCVFWKCRGNLNYIICSQPIFYINIVHVVSFHPDWFDPNEIAEFITCMIVKVIPFFVHSPFHILWWALYWSHSGQKWSASIAILCDEKGFHGNGKWSRCQHFPWWRNCTKGRREFKMSTFFNAE